MKTPSKVAPYTLAVNLAMSVIYFASGIFFMTSDSSSALIPDAYKPIFGGVLIFYGLFRTYRSYAKYKEIKDGN